MNSNPATPLDVPTAFTATIEGTWFVQTRAGIASLTLEELDQAYQRGDVDAATPVFTAGMRVWETLGSLANLDGAVASDQGAPSGPQSSKAVVDVLDPAEGGSFPPTSSGVFGGDGVPESSGTASDVEAHTVVRRSTGVLPFPIRKAAGTLADLAAQLRLSHPRLAAAGPWLFGVLLSGIFIFSLYQLGAASTRPGAHTKSGWITARTTTTEQRAVVAPVSAAPVVGRAPGTPAALDHDTPTSASAASEVAVVRPIDLQLARSSRAETALARSARAKAAKAARASASRDPRTRPSRKLARRATQRRSNSAID